MPTEISDHHLESPQQGWDLCGTRLRAEPIAQAKVLFQCPPQAHDGPPTSAAVEYSTDVETIIRCLAAS